MTPFIETIYLTELLSQCDEAMEAVRRMNMALAAKEPRPFFRAASDFLQHAALASRMLWPPGRGNVWQRKSADMRGAHLRSSLDIGKTHGLRNRDLRDHFEHYDERLDDWAENSPNKNIVDNMIGPRRAIGGDAIKDSDIMRLYDPATKQLVFRGESFDMQALVAAVEDVKGKALKRHEEIDPWRQAGEDQTQIKR